MQIFANQLTQLPKQLIGFGTFGRRKYKFFLHKFYLFMSSRKSLCKVKYYFPTTKETVLGKRQNQGKRLKKHKKDDKI